MKRIDLYGVPMPFNALPPGRDESTPGMVACENEGCLFTFFVPVVSGADVLAVLVLHADRCPHKHVAGPLLP